MGDQAKILVVYYSRTGNTRKVAEVLARLLHADLEQIVDTQNRMGLRGYFRSGREAFFQRKTVLRPPERSPADYSLVVVGTPVWNVSLSSPVRTYLELMRRRLPAVAFFLTHQGMGGRRVLAQMAQVAGKAPVASLALREQQVTRGEFLARLQPYVEQLLTSELPLSPRGADAEHPATH
jgi:flavodoxin